MYVQQSEIDVPSDSTDPAAIYRQRVYDFLDDGSDIRLKIWKFENASKYVDAQRHPSILSSITTSELTTDPACDVFWVRHGDSFLSHMNDTCSVTLNGTYYKITDTNIVTAEFVTIHERWYSSEGKEVMGLKTPINETKAPSWPVQIAPGMPTMFSAKVHGFAAGTNETGVWHYDWPRNRLRNDYVLLQGPNSTENVTQLWLAGEDKFYSFSKQGCVYFSLGVGMLRPDHFEHAMMVDAGESYYASREFVAGQWTDHFVSGPVGPNRFNLWSSIETNYPVLDYGPSGSGGIGANYWSDFDVGRVPESMFDMDTSKCKKTAVTLEALGKLPALLASHLQYPLYGVNITVDMYKRKTSFNSTEGLPEVGCGQVGDSCSGEGLGSCCAGESCQATAPGSTIRHCIKM